MLASYAIPNLAQGISQQPDAQRDPSQGEIQINGMSSILEGLRKRDCSQTVAWAGHSLGAKRNATGRQKTGRLRSTALQANSTGRKTPLSKQ